MAKIPDNIFKSYDIRAIYPEEINEENIYPIVQAIYKFFTEKVGLNRPLKIVTGRDTRLSGDKLYPILLSSLIDAGASVIDIGLVPTTTVYFTVYDRAYDAGIQLSASHNPPKYNGIKMVVNDINGLTKIGKNTGIDKIKEYANSSIVLKSTVPGSILKITDAISREVEKTAKIIDIAGIKKLKVVADSANAMGGLYIEELFKLLPCELIKMNFNLDGNFPAHDPDPLIAANLKSLQERVVAEGADLGLAPDGDGDRMFFIDEKGAIVNPSSITALVARELLKTNHDATILFDIRYTITPREIIELSGGKSYPTKVGHAYITEAMATHNALFAGESSGHYYFKATGNTESQIPMIIAVLKVMSDSAQPLSKINESIRRSYESGEYNFETEKAVEIMNSLKNKYSEANLVTLDGVSFEFPAWRFNVRSSNTESLMRLNVEAKNHDVMIEKTKELTDFISSFGAKLT